MLTTGAQIEIVSAIRHETTGIIERCMYWLAAIRHAAADPELDLERLLEGAAGIDNMGLRLVDELEGEFRRLEQTLRRLGVVIGSSDSSDG